LPEPEDLAAQPGDDGTDRLGICRSGHPFENLHDLHETSISR